MKTPLLVLFSFLSFSSLFSHPPLWVVGKTYVALLQNGQTKYWNEVTPSSFGMDPQRCELWAVDSKTSNLLKFSQLIAQPHSLGTTEAIVSNVEDSTFFSRKGGLLEKRNSAGTVSQTYPFAETSNLIEIHSAEKGYVTLQKADKELSFSSMNDSFALLHRTVVSSNADLWNVERLIYDASSGVSWIGFTATTASHMYAPILKSYTLDGTLKSKQIYNHRGIFWDFCLQTDHSLLYSYDVPSNSGFTVPINSYLDAFTSMGMSSQVYSADTNYFIDAVTCSQDAVYMLQRPIFGSEKSLIVSSRLGNKQEETLLTLPAPAYKVFHCDG